MLALALLLAALDFAQLERQFQYDAAQPLAIEQKLLFDRDGVRVYDLTYASPKGGRVTAYLTVPARPGNYAGIVFGHWGPGNRTEFLPEAQIYSRAGAVCLMIDYPWTRPAPWHADADDIEEPAKSVELQTQAVIDLRRGLDLLTAHEGVDAKRLAYVGHSYGAQLGAILSAVDKRLRTAVLMAGIPDNGAVALEGNTVGIAKWRERTGVAKIEASLVILRATAAIEYVPHAAPTPLLFQFARLETSFSTPAMERFAAAASHPKTVLWYDTGHELNDPRALGDRARWLARHLTLRSVDRQLRTAPGRE
ncbi:MAG: hypothetical protein R2762_15980 [Bryobacteraceae bacterium]